MPFDPSNPPSKVKGLSPKKQRQFVHVFNGCFSKHHDDARCHAEAWSVVKKAHQMEIESRVLRIASLLVADDWERQIFDVVAKETNAGMAKIIVPWIKEGLIGNDFITKGLDNIRFTYIDNDKMRFTAIVDISLPDKGVTGRKTYRWNLLGKKYKGIISSDNSGE